MSDKIYYVKYDYLLKAIANSRTSLIIVKKINKLPQLPKPKYNYCQDSKGINELYRLDLF